MPDSGGGRLLECEGLLRRLKDGQMRLPSGENDLRF
jgi:hypothetical protein